MVLRLLPLYGASGSDFGKPTAHLLFITDDTDGNLRWLKNREALKDALSVPPRGMGCPQSYRKKKSEPSDRILPDGRNVLIEAFGEKKTLRDWAADSRCQVPYLRLRTRLKKNWTLEDAITVVPAAGNRNVEAFGESKSLYTWKKDPRCLVHGPAVYSGSSAETAGIGQSSE
jgi:hypothetical protein